MWRPSRSAGQKVAESVGSVGDRGGSSTSSARRDPVPLIASSRGFLHTVGSALAGRSNRRTSPCRRLTTVRSAASRSRRGRRAPRDRSPHCGRCGQPGHWMAPGCGLGRPLRCGRGELDHPPRGGTRRGRPQHRSASSSGCQFLVQRSSRPRRPSNGTVRARSPRSGPGRDRRPAGVLTSSGAAVPVHGTARRAGHR